MIQREHMTGKESLRRAVWDVAHDWYRLFGCFAANANVGRILILRGIELYWPDDHTLALCTSI